MFEAAVLSGTRKSCGLRLREPVLVTHTQRGCCDPMVVALQQRAEDVSDHVLGWLTCAFLLPR